MYSSVVLYSLCIGFCGGRSCRGGGDERRSPNRYILLMLINCIQQTFHILQNQPTTAIGRVQWVNRNYSFLCCAVLTAYIFIWQETGLGGDRDRRIGIHVTIRFTALEYLHNTGSTNGDCEALTEDRHKTQIGKVCKKYLPCRTNSRHVQGQPLLKHE